MTKEEAKAEINKVFEPAFANYIITALTEGATPSERKTGKWEIYVISMLDGEGCRCSECGFEGAPYWDYCPVCGAKMEGVENGTD